MANLGRDLLIGSFIALAATVVIITVAGAKPSPTLPAYCVVSCIEPKTEQCLRHCTPKPKPPKIRHLETAQ